MGIFKNLMGNNETKTQKTSNVSWINLEDLGQLTEIQETSFAKPVIIFKHSTTCSISRMALKNFEREYRLNEKIDAYYLDLLNFRPISNEIATRFNVTHQSPQLLLIKQGKSVYNVSHENIDAAALETEINL